MAVKAPRGRRPLLRRLLGAPGAALLSTCAVIASSALVWSPVVWADELPPPTTTTDAPPPDRYTPPKPAPKPKRVGPVTHVAPRVTLQTYTPPTVVQSVPRSATPKPKHKVVHRAKVVHKRKRTEPVQVVLAPIAHIVAASRLPALRTRDEQRPYLWLAGLSFAVLALAGLSLQLLTVRYFRPELR